MPPHMDLIDAKALILSQIGCLRQIVLSSREVVGEFATSFSTYLD